MKNIAIVFKNIKDEEVKAVGDLLTELQEGAFFEEEIAHLNAKGDIILSFCSDDYEVVVLDTEVALLKV